MTGKKVAPTDHDPKNKKDDPKNKKDGDKTKNKLRKGSGAEGGKIDPKNKKDGDKTKNKLRKGSGAEGGKIDPKNKKDGDKTKNKLRKGSGAEGGKATGKKGKDQIRTEEEEGDEAEEDAGKGNRDRRDSRKAEAERELEEQERLNIIQEQEKKRRKSIQKEKEKKQLEKELKKKLAYHHIDKDEVQDSEESIYIAPPAPENRISVVTLVVCGVAGYRKCLLICSALQFIAAIAQFAVFVYVAAIWPMGFSLEFKVTIQQVNPHTLVFIAASQPLVTFLWLLLATLLASRQRICHCFRNKSLWYLRAFYVYSPLLLVIPLISVIFCILYVGHLDVDSLEQTMFKHLNLYDANEQSRVNWDTTQEYEKMNKGSVTSDVIGSVNGSTWLPMISHVKDNHLDSMVKLMTGGHRVLFECCGVDKDGWRNWEQREMVEEDFIDWIVPRSCCRENVDYVQCMNETIDDFVWHVGCLQQLYKVYVLYGHLAILTVVASILISCVSVYFSTKYYRAIRLKYDPSFEFDFSTYFLECFCCCRRCRHL